MFNKKPNCVPSAPPSVSAGFFGLGKHILCSCSPYLLVSVRRKKECWVFSPTNPQWNKGNSTVHNCGCPAIPGFRSCGPVDPKVPATSIHRGIRNTLRCFCGLLGVSSQSVCGTFRNKVYLRVVADQLTVFGEKMIYFFGVLTWNLLFAQPKLSSFWAKAAA